MGVVIGSPRPSNRKTGGRRGPQSSDKRVRTAPATPSAIELHIEELVLHGFPAGDRFGIGDAVQQELARLLGEQGLPGVMAHPVNIDRIDAGAIQVGAGARPRMIGTQLAETLHQQFAPAHGRTRRQPRGKQP